MTEAASLYEEDFHAWTQRQARELRRLKGLRLNTDLDLDHLAKEVRDLGSEQLHAVKSRLRRLIEHLLKLEFSARGDPRRQWLMPVADARAEINDRLSRSLGAKLATALPREYERARERARLVMEDDGGGGGGAVAGGVSVYVGAVA